MCRSNITTSRGELWIKTNLADENGCADAKSIFSAVTYMYVPK